MPTACVIGAGPSGIAAAKALLDAGVRTVVYERNHEVGGNWLFSESPTHSSVFSTTHIISSKTWSQYDDFPMPADYPDYPSHRQLADYFQAYARQFGLYEHIRFGHGVEHCDPIKGTPGGWRVTVNGRSEDFEHLLVCNGHHWDPRWPNYPGNYSGRLMHSHDWKSNRGMDGLRVLVVGGGNSACDCAVEASRVASHTAISMRRGYWFLPKFQLGQPNDVLYAKLAFLPFRWRQKLLASLYRFFVGDFADYGLQEPDHEILEAHPTTNSELLDKIRHGDVHPRVDIERFDGKTVHFVDGRAEEYDVVVCCTGFHITFPFFDRALVDFASGDVPLYLNVFHPRLPNAYFIGLVQPLGCIWPLSEQQARLVAGIVKGRIRLPADLDEAIRKDRARRPHFMATPRHSVEVDYHDYRARLVAAAEKYAV